MYDDSKIKDSNGRCLVTYTLQNISGIHEQAASFDGIRITRVTDVGSEKDFHWIVNGKSYPIHNGDYLIFTGFDLRLPLVSKKPSTVIIQVIRLESAVFFPHTELIGVYYSSLRRASPVITGEYARNLDADFDRIVTELQREDNYAVSSVMASVWLMTASLCRLLCYTPNGGDDISETAVRIVEYISEHFTEKLTIGMVARQFGISESMLSKLMKRYFDISFPLYVRRVRVNHVIGLINCGQFGVLEAAEMSGFSSVSGFYKSFREITGMSPTALLRADNPINTT